jgi:mannose-1-phosphate guanylyltransferase
LKALILAGGFGTRLRPLSCTRPKLLFPIGNVPLLDLTLRRLAKSGVEEVILAVNFMADQLKQAFGQERCGVKLHYSEDKVQDSKSSGSPKALGTGGPIKQAEKLLVEEDVFLVLNGDILVDFDYSDILKAHSSHNGVATLALHEVDDPSRYGVAKLTTGNRIEEFFEKPSEKAPSNLVNAGIYVFEPKIFRYIPFGERCSIEREVFPKLAKEGSLFGYVVGGLWIDVGKPMDYIRANALWIATRSEKDNLIKTNVGEGKVQGNVVIGEDVRIGKGSVVGPDVSIGDGVFIGDGVQVQNSVIFSHVTILEGSTIRGSIIGEFVTLGRNVKVERGCLIGDHANVQDNTLLKRDTRVCPSKDVNSETALSQCIM